MLLNVSGNYLSFNNTGLYKEIKVVAVVFFFFLSCRFFGGFFCIRVGKRVISTVFSCQPAFYFG